LYQKKYIKTKVKISISFTFVVTVCVVGGVVVVVVVLDTLGSQISNTQKFGSVSGADSAPISQMSFYHLIQ
jgi:cell division septal protein FtsQ